MEARIAPAPQPWSERIRARLDRIRPILLFRVLARDERLFERFMSGGFLDRGHLTMRERELAILRVCALNGSDYEWGVHVQVFAEAAGFTPAELHRTTQPSPSLDWTGRDAIIVQLCEALQSSCEVADAQWGELVDTFGEMAVLELLLLIGKYRQVCILTNALRLQPEAGAPLMPRTIESERPVP